jgi:hypothetical protein
MKPADVDAPSLGLAVDVEREGDGVLRRARPAVLSAPGLEIAALTDVHGLSLRVREEIDAWLTGNGGVLSTSKAWGRLGAGQAERGVEMRRVPKVWSPRFLLARRLVGATEQPYPAHARQPRRRRDGGGTRRVGLRRRLGGRGRGRTRSPSAWWPRDTTRAVDDAGGEGCPKDGHRDEESITEAMENLARTRQTWDGRTSATDRPTDELTTR